ncbi:Asp23/Gls24 family envelope stress response protein [Tyzzerella sp. An114]|uniref:Asp23/Gls24 family envelope stress response protein n=1 Tax=Tyzzerella sp. An114 TaxID=1965545 RepID=UPI000B43B34B|nr:Asp23/Gls24 family envelope stress response protein [Tyzzerella sp. An114]OUQ58863.1 Asp23/Gls24 family envelope stress response protein [Tyzzerella sp. An114]HIT73612.1 Asp23/Gls24 family envelope stress response protein [Candidatus Fimicola cottocaccae]
MSAKLENDYGVITIENEVIARIAGYAAMDCYGIVGMAAKNVKDGIVQLLKKESLTKGIKLTVNENKISLDFHIIVEYGTNITAIADNIISTVKYKVEEFAGLEVENVNIFVEGVRVDN